MGRKSRDGSIVQLYGKCVKEGKAKDLAGPDLVKYVGRCLVERVEVKKRPEEVPG